MKKVLGGALFMAICMVASLCGAQEKVDL